jgi:serine/threonine protein kinase
LKQLTGPSYNVAGDWQNEKDALFVFNQLGDEHIVKGIGAFTKRGKYYLLMEWADGGNLQQFWENNPDPHLTMTAQQVIELLTQFRGLAYALNRMHHYRARQEKTKSCSVSINTPGENEDETSWRHGDLKPGNILRFKDPSNSSNWVGTLKIGDLGRVRQHLDKTGKRKIGTSELFSTWRYEAPESWTSLSSPRSRLYDIWSLGCVILDSVIWMLYGAKKLKEFEAVVREPGHGSPYWTYESSRVNRKKAKIRDNVSALMQDMLDFHPECKAPSALRDLICLVRDKLLVVKLSPDADKFTPKCRANSFTLVEELDEIIRKAKNCSSYLFKGSDVTGIRAPSLNKHLPKIDYLTPDRQLTPANFVTRRTPSPFAGRPDDEPTRKHDSYSHDFDDTWKQEEDNTFAEDVLRRPEIDYQSLTPVSQSMLCPKCRSLDFAAPSLKIKDKVEELRKSIQKGCKFCDMRLQVAEKFHSGETFEFSKDSSGLQLNINARGPPVLSLYRTPVALSSASYSPKLRASSSYKYELTNNIQDEGLEKGPNYIQIGFPTIPQAGNDTHIGLLNAWLEDCDTKHEKCRPIYPPIDYPTRLLDLGSKDSQTLRLIESLSLPESEKATFKYIALSHPWGDPKCHQHLCTTSANIRNYRVQIRDQLPATLADAVKITRSLGVRYLWVDCLCIIQGDDGDFAEEAERMETVFSSAYFVIAATSAEGMSSGFLNRTSRRQVNRQAGHDIVCLPHRSKTGKIESMIYVDAAFNDFEKDVRDGPLNQRGWVFQERALARRTIHFTNNQTYWECGEGIRCETLTKMKNNYESFLGDPNFPNYGLRHKKGGDIAFYEFLYEQYSTLSFTRPEDRPVAIGGLEQRLIGALKQKGRSGLGSFGIFDDYWGRGLLWQRSSDTPKMTRLTSRAGGGSPAPSWSWMGHTGGITFMKHNPHSVKWLPSEIVFPWSDQQGPRASTTSYRGDLGLRGFARGFRLPESGDSADRLDIVYEDKDLLVGRQLKCVVIGRMNLENRSMKQVRNYVLILAELKIPGRVHVYERVGAGFIHGSLIEFAADPLSVSID